MKCEFAILGLLLIVGCRPSPVQDLKTPFENVEVVQVISDARKVKAYQLQTDPPSSRPVPSDKLLLTDLEAISGPIELYPQTVGELNRTFLDRESYLCEISKACVPFYGIRLQYEDPRGDVDILLCFECDQLLIFHRGEKVDFKDFDPAHEKLLTIAKSVFPNLKY